MEHKGTKITKSRSGLSPAPVWVWVVMGLAKAIIAGAVHLFPASISHSALMLLILVHVKCFWDLNACTAFGAMIVQCIPVDFRFFMCKLSESNLWILFSAAACWQSCCQPAASVIHRMREMVKATRAVILWGLLEHLVCANLSFCSVCLGFGSSLGRCGVAVFYRQHGAGDNCKLFNGAMHCECEEMRWE